MLPLRLALLLLLLLLSAEATAKGTDVAADTITRNAEGAIVAEGDVVITREGETLKADKVIYDAANKEMRASGRVVIETRGSTIEADKARMQTEDRSGSLEQATATLNDGARLQATQFRRLSETLFEAEEVRFTACPPGDESWSIHAKSAELDQEEGYLTARHARFEVGGVPVLYTPVWQHSLRRRSGFLMPSFGSSQRRGTEWALPYFWAPATNWDATLTPRWMTRRGLMGELELRHVAPAGSEEIRVEGLNDKVLSQQRSRMQAQVHHALSDKMHFDLSADHLSDLDYLADFPDDTELASTPYLQSQAAISGADHYGKWTLFSRHQQNLRSTNNNADTLQIVPRFESSVRLPVAGDRALFLFDQQTTLFSRKIGVDGWRMDLSPSLEIPWELAGGGLSSTLHLGARHTRYWLKDTLNPRTPHRNTLEASLDTRATFERISSDQQWRHAIMPVIRLDLSTAPDQSTLPNFDSAFSRLSMGNLMAGNRYTGHDRIERMQRLSMLLESELQHKGEENKSLTVASAKVGLAYDFKRETVDAARSPAPTRPFSNLLGAVTLRPMQGIALTANGQYDPAAGYWATGYAALSVRSDNDAHQLQLSWQQTDARYATASQLISANASTRVAQRWELFGHWQYDQLRKLTQQAGSGIRYTHPCWDLMLEGYRSNLAGSDAAADYGFRFLLGFKGLGSVGS